MVVEIVEVVRERIRIDGGGVLVRIACEEVNIVLDLVINTAVDLVLVLRRRRGHHAVVVVICSTG